MTGGGLALGRAALRAADDRGSVAAEVAVVAPVLLVLLILVIVAGRVTHAATDVQAAATAGARAASLRSSPDAAARAAHDSAVANLAAAGTGCRSLDIETATDRLRPGGSVSVTVRCGVTFSDLALVSLPGERSFTAEATEVVDTYLGSGSR